MTNAQLVRNTDKDTDQDRRCTVCNHDLADHDRISLRFCQATQTQAFSRNCICP